MPEFVPEDEMEESDVSDLEDWADREEPSLLESGEDEEEERVAIGKKRTRRPHVEIEYETELEPRSKLKA